MVNPTLNQRVQLLEDKVETLEERTHEMEHRTPPRVSSGGAPNESLLVEALQAEVLALRRDMEDMDNRVRVMNRIIATGGGNDRGEGNSNRGSTFTGTTEAPRLRVPEPKTFNGARDAKELENFLFDME